MRKDIAIIVRLLQRLASDYPSTLAEVNDAIDAVYSILWEAEDGQFESSDLQSPQ